MRERFHATELNEDDRSTRRSEMIRQRRKVVIPRLGEDRIPFPTEIAAAQLRLSLNENRFDVAAMLRGRDVAAADKRDDILSAELNYRGRSARKRNKT